MGNFNPYDGLSSESVVNAAKVSIILSVLSFGWATADKVQRMLGLRSKAQTVAVGVYF